MAQRRRGHSFHGRPRNHPVATTTTTTTTTSVFRLSLLFSEANFISSKKRATPTPHNSSKTGVLRRKRAQLSGEREREREREKERKKEREKDRESCSRKDRAWGSSSASSKDKDKDEDNNNNNNNKMLIIRIRPNPEVPIIKRTNTTKEHLRLRQR